MNAVGLAQAVAHAVIPDDRFKAARQEIEQRPCLKPLGTTVWVTSDTMRMDPTKRWRDMGHGVFWLVGE